MKAPEKILIVRTDRLGDVILSTPVIKNLRLSFPKSWIAFMCRPYTKDVLMGNPYLDEVIVYDKYGTHKRFIASMKFAFALKKKKFDWAVILHPTNRVHLITFFAGIPLRVGWNRQLGFLLTKKLVHNKQQGLKHEMEYSLDILKALKVPISDVSLYFPVNQENERFLEVLLKEKGIESKDALIVLHPSASCVSKRWPLTHFSHLITLLKEEFHPKIAVITSDSEKQLSDALFTEHPDLIDLRGAVDISSLASLLVRTTLFISNDSGPVHIAASVHTPVISIFGRNDPGLSPRRWGPLGKNCFYVHKDIGCLRCLAHNCEKNFLCLWKITPEEVFSIAKDIMQEQIEKNHRGNHSRFS